MPHLLPHSPPPQFYAKFSLRQSISEVLQYLWSQPSHKEVWKSFSRHEGLGTGDYVRFCNMLISDSIFLLDDRWERREVAEWSREGA